MSERSQRDLWILAGVVAAAVGAFLAPAFFTGQGFMPMAMLWRVPPWNNVLPAMPNNGLLSDQLFYFWPWRVFLRDQLLSGHFPLWNPLIAAGVPFLACVQAAPLFPTTLLLTVLSPAEWSLAAAFVKLFAAGFFTALHVRRLGADRPGAALAGVSFALCGFMIAWLGHPHTNVACLLPALFWSIGRAAENGRAKDWTPVAVVVGLLLLGGHPPTAMHALLAGAAYVVFLARQKPPHDRIPLFKASSLSVLAGCALAAPAVLPYLEYVTQSSQSAASSGLARWGTHLSLWSLLHFVMPLASGTPGRMGEILSAAFPVGPESNFLERAGWLGLPALAFAAYAASRRWEDRSVRFHLYLGAFALASVLGVPPLPWLWRILPGYSQVNPTRLLLVLCFAGATLAGLGCREEDEPAPRRFLLGAAAFALAAVLIDFGALARFWSQFLPEERGYALGQSFAFILEASLAALLLARPALRRWSALVAAPFLLRAAFGVNMLAPNSVLYPATPGIEALKAEQGEGRVTGLGWTAAPDIGMALGLRDARGRDFTALRRYERVVTGNVGDFDFYQAPDALPLSPALLAVSAVAATPKMERAVPPDWTKVYDGDMLIYRAPVPARRALYVPEARVLSAAEVLAAVRVPAFDPSRVVYLDDWFTAPPASGGRGIARVVSETSDEVNVEVEADKPGWLLLLDTYYPGWRVEVNGELAALRRADYAFRAVAVPGGRTTVRFTYVPYSLWIGLALALLAAAGLSWVSARSPN